MILTGKCKADFLRKKRVLIQMLPDHVVHLIIYRWFNTETKICIDLQHWQNEGFDFAVTHPYLDVVYQSSKVAGNRETNFDKNLKEALDKANNIYNKTL